MMGAVANFLSGGTAGTDRPRHQQPCLPNIYVVCEMDTQLRLLGQFLPLLQTIMAKKPGEFHSTLVQIESAHSTTTITADMAFRLADDLGLFTHIVRVKTSSASGVAIQTAYHVGRIQQIIAPSDKIVVVSRDADCLNELRLTNSKLELISLDTLTICDSLEAAAVNLARGENAESP